MTMSVGLVLQHYFIMTCLLSYRVWWGIQCLRITCHLPQNDILQRKVFVDMEKYIGVPFGGNCRYLGLCIKFSEVLDVSKNWNLWCYHLQNKLETGSTIIPVLLGIDETHVNLLGQMKVHPLYMTIGNIHKQIRRGYSQNAYRVLAYFLVLEATKLERWKEAFKVAKRTLYHMCMSKCLGQLWEYGKRYGNIYSVNCWAGWVVHKFTVQLWSPE